MKIDYNGKIREMTDEEVAAIAEENEAPAVDVKARLAELQAELDALSLSIS